MNEKADKADKPEDAAAIVKQCEDINRTKKENIISKNPKWKSKRVWISKSHLFERKFLNLNFYMPEAYNCIEKRLISFA